jgi:ribosomal protein S8
LPGILSNQNQKTMKKNQIEKSKSRVNTNPIIRVRAFVFDVYAKCQSVNKIVFNEITAYHKIGRNIAVILRDGGYIQKIKTTPSDERGFAWIADPPNDQMIEEIHNAVQAYHKSFVITKKPEVIKQPVLDFNQPEPVSEPVAIDDDNDEMSLLKRLLKKHFNFDFQK